jgi:hypothetical protein
MKWNTPKDWRRGFQLCRRRKGTDSLGNATAEYDMEHPDEVYSAEEGIDIQPPRSWNSSSRLDSVGAHLADWGETAGGVLEGYVMDALEVNAFDRLVIDGAVYEVRSVQRWPGHRQVLMQRVE